MWDKIYKFLIIAFVVTLMCRYHDLLCRSLDLLSPSYDFFSCCQINSWLRANKTLQLAVLYR